LRVLAVNEPELTKAIGRLRGEWSERSGGELEASDVTWPDLAKADAIDADLIVLPSRYLGEMCTRGWLRPVRESTLDSEEFDVVDVFPVLQRGLMIWGDQTMALPLGVKVTLQPNIIEPSGMALLNAAAPTAVSSDRIGVLFDPDTMKPRITEAPFVDALTKLSQDENSDADPTSQIPVLGFDDRLIAVSAKSRNAATAFKLLAWLASADISSQLASTGDHLLPARRSLASSSKWYGSNVSAAERTSIATNLTDLLSSQRELIVPRIPGIDDYMTALNEAVNSVLNDNVSPHEALTKASARWEEITDSRGRDAQRQAYLKHLGIED
jgi:hypothetical protein